MRGEQRQTEVDRDRYRQKVTDRVRKKHTETLSWLEDDETVDFYEPLVFHLKQKF